MAATGIYRAIRVDWTNPNTDTFCNAEIYVASVNNRASSVLLAAPPGLQDLEQSYTHAGLTPGDVRYYWWRPRDFDGTFGAYEPSGATAGWQGTALGIQTGDITFTDTATIDHTYAAGPPPVVTSDVKTNSILYSLIQTISAASKLLGRGSASGAGNTQEITLGTGLTMSGTTLSASGSSTQGRHTIYVDAAAMTPATSLGAAAVQLEMATNKNAMRVMAFADVGTKLYAHFKLALPKAWNLGTLTYRVHWTLNSTSTNSALFGLQAVATSDGDALDVAYGTAIEVTDNGLGSAAYKKHLSAESSAMTIAGTPANADMLDFRFYRDPTADSFVGTVYVLGIELFYTTSADTDA